MGLPGRHLHRKRRHQTPASRGDAALPEVRSDQIHDCALIVYSWFNMRLVWFHSISMEFLALMKKVTKSPLVMDVLNIQGVQRSLERLADLLGKIQKALGEYLERERSSFPRSDIWALRYKGAGYRVQYFLGTDRIASIPSSIVR